MKLRPREDQAFLATREVACSSLNWIQYVDADMVLIVGVEVGQVMGPTGLNKHPDDDSEKPRNLRHRFGRRFRQLPNLRDAFLGTLPPYY